MKVNCGVKNYLKEDHRSYIPYKPEFLSGFLFATAKGANITPAVHIYDFHIFIISLSTLSIQI